MITVKKITENIKAEGMNTGLPTTFIELGDGSDYDKVEALVLLLLKTTKCPWVCIFGEETVRVGIGALVKGLQAIGRQVEIECLSQYRDPGWIHSVDRWTVDYLERGVFNYGALRGQDMVRFGLTTEEDLVNIEKGLEKLKLFLGTKYIKMSKGLSPALKTEAFNLVRKHDKTRVYYY